MADRKAKDKREKRVVSAKKRVEQHSSGGRTTLNLPENAPLLSVKQQGLKKLDVIPYVVGKGNPYADEGELHFERTYWVHRGIGANNDAYTCAAKSANKPCYVCEYRARLTKQGGDEQVIKDLAPKERQLFNVIDRDDQGRGIQIWELSYHLFGKALDKKIRTAEDDDGYEFFADLERGFTLRIGVSEEKSGSMSWFNFSDIEFKPRKPLPEDLVEQAYCLDELVRVPSYEELKKVFLQSGEEKDDDKEEEEEEKSPKRGPGRPPVKGKAPPVDEDEDEDLEDEDTEEGDEEDDTPLPSKKPEAKEKESPAGAPVKTATGAGLAVGDLVMYGDLECEILAVSKDGTTLTLEDEDGKKVKGVGAGEVKPLDDEDGEEDEDEDTPPPGKGKAQPPEEDEDEDDEDEEPVKTPPPAKKPPTKKGKGKK